MRYVGKLIRHGNGQGGTSGDTSAAAAPPSSLSVGPPIRNIAPRRRPLACHAPESESVPTSFLLLQSHYCVVTSLSSSTSRLSLLCKVWSLPAGYSALPRAIGSVSCLAGLTVLKPKKHLSSGNETSTTWRMDKTKRNNGRERYGGLTDVKPLIRGLSVISAP